MRITWTKIFWIASLLTVIVNLSLLTSIDFETISSDVGNEDIFIMIQGLILGFSLFVTLASFFNKKISKLFIEQGNINSFGDYLYFVWHHIARSLLSWLGTTFGVIILTGISFMALTFYSVIGTLRLWQLGSYPLVILYTLVAALPMVQFGIYMLMKIQKLPRQKAIIYYFGRFIPVVITAIVIIKFYGGNFLSYFIPFFN